MPISLNNLAASTKAKVYSPKFFDDALTGSGKVTGILCADNNPINSISKTRNTALTNIECKHSHYTNGDAKVTTIPFYIISSSNVEYAAENKSSIPAPDTKNMVKIATHNTMQNQSVYMDMLVHSITIEEITNTDGTKSKAITPCYELRFYNTDSTTAMEVTYTKTHNVITIRKPNIFMNEFSCNPFNSIDTVIVALSRADYTIHQNSIDTYLANYSLYDAVVRRSKEWQTEIDKTIENWITSINPSLLSTQEYLNQLAITLRFIESYKVPLDLYKNIYNILDKTFCDDILSILCKQNLNLLLSNTLHNLETNKNILTCIPQSAPTNLTSKYYSPEQRIAIESKEPLILVQAGAGTGKSTVILGRIDYMVNAGINPDDITVLSFTNAAADNITERNPNVHSMTISKMIHQIYSTNFPTHELSTLDTIINSIRIYYKRSDDIANGFVYRLTEIKKNGGTSAFTSMNNFIEKHYDAVIDILNNIKQTSLELESIITYQKIGSFKEPSDIKSKYLIVDEVQDNSIFDFIYTLKYVDHHKESLFIVGDCSQTLYEFRASNPRTLNVLEGSGVFATYQLQINYRSNQEILDFANVVLSNIEANQFANIQLHANSFSQVTEQSFIDKVTLDYKQLSKQADFTDALGSIVAVNMRSYIDDKLAKHEQVAVLAYTRNTIYKMQSILQNMYPDKKIVNLIPDKMYNSTIFSGFIDRYWDTIQFAPAQDIITVISQSIISKLTYLVFNKDKALPSVRKLIANWYNEQGGIIASHQALYNQGVITKDEFLQRIKTNMIAFEIKHNSVKQALLSAGNKNGKDENTIANADFILSTIHSAKGREFDNVIVIHKNENSMAEDKKRMYYVAFTRAKKTEYILSYDTVAHSKIKNDYDSIVSYLHNTATQTAVTTDCDDVAVIEEQTDNKDENIA